MTQVRYKDNGLWQTTELPQDCPLCGGIVEKNKYKTEDKHPDYKCTNREKGIDGKYECGCGFWLAKEKQPAKQLQKSPTLGTGEQILLTNILAELKEIKEFLRPTHI